MTPEIKAKFIRELGELLARYTETEVESAVYTKEGNTETAIVNCKGGGVKMAFVSGNNCLSILANLIGQEH